MNRTLSLAALGAAVALAAGCASTPEEVEEVVVVEPEPTPTPTPVAEPEPAPTPVVVEQTGPLAGSIEDFVVNVGDKIYYEVDRYNLDDSDRAVLQAQAQWLLAYPDVKVLVAGNCDERGTREYNIALGERRAASARDYLIALGVEASRVEMVSYGKDRPVDPRSTADAWAVNRNAQTQIVGGAIN